MTAEINVLRNRNRLRTLLMVELEVVLAPFCPPGSGSAFESPNWPVVVVPKVLAAPVEMKLTPI